MKTPLQPIDKYFREVGIAFMMDQFQGEGPVEIHESLDVLDRSLDPKSLYVVFGTFEGQWEVARFDSFESSIPDVFPSHPIQVDERVDPITQWKSTLDESSYLRYVNAIRQEIEAGWVYQVNACRLLSNDADIDLVQLFARIRQRHRAPAAGYYRGLGWEIASASPETFFRVSHHGERREIMTSPIKGTSRDGNFKEKDQAENVMIVDLMRNDISPLCRIGTVDVPRLLGVEEHPGLFHLVSDVVGELREDVTWKEIVERLTPAGSISGAPKSSALEVIRRFEPYRGAYCGTLGWIRNGEAHFSVLIRTFFKDLRKDPRRTFFGTGAGITWGSDAIDEWRETELKAERLTALAASVVAGIRS